MNTDTPTTNRSQLSEQTHLQPTDHSSVNTDTSTTNRFQLNELRHAYNQCRISMNTDTPITNRSQLKVHRHTYNQNTTLHCNTSHLNDIPTTTNQHTMLKKNKTATVMGDSGGTGEEKQNKGEC